MATHAETPPFYNETTNSWWTGDKEQKQVVAKAEKKKAMTSRYNSNAMLTKNACTGINYEMVWDVINYNYPLLAQFIGKFGYGSKMIQWNFCLDVFDYWDKGSTITVWEAIEHTCWTRYKEENWENFEYRTADMRWHKLTPYMLKSCPYEVMSRQQIYDALMSEEWIFGGLTRWKRNSEGLEVDPRDAEIRKPKKIKPIIRLRT